MIRSQLKVIGFRNEKPPPPPFLQVDFITKDVYTA